MFVSVNTLKKKYFFFEHRYCCFIDLTLNPKGRHLCDENDIIIRVQFRKKNNNYLLTWGYFTLPLLNTIHYTTTYDRVDVINASMKIKTLRRNFCRFNLFACLSFFLNLYKPILCWLCPKTEPNAMWSFGFSVGFVLRTDEQSEPKNDANTFALDKGVLVFSVKILMDFIGRG